MNASNVVDLTSRSRGPSDECSDDEDERAFGGSRTLREFYKKKIWRLRHNDPNYCLVKLYAGELPNDLVVSRVGRYLSSTKHVKNLQLVHCSLTAENMEQLFGKIAQQIETNEYLVKNNILSNLGVNENTLVESIIESLTYFQRLVKIDVSCNGFGASGLDVLVKALAGCPVQNLEVCCCGFKSISPLMGLKKCTELDRVDISGNDVGNFSKEDVKAMGVLLSNGHPKLRQLELSDCNIDGKFIQMMIPLLRKNKTLRYLMLHQCQKMHARRFIPDHMKNHIGEDGESALCKTIHDTSSFLNTLQSNHFIRKIPGTGNRFFEAIKLNHYYTHRGPYTIGLMKYLTHCSNCGSFDLSPFTEVDINLLPRVLARLGNLPKCPEGMSKLDIFYKMLSCKVFRERIQAASRISNLESIQLKDQEKIAQLKDENAMLRQQLTALTLTNNPTSTTTNVVSDGSIAERVKKKRADVRKRARN
jgi:hypothetical protein